jgi:hypothetical protein
MKTDDEYQKKVTGENRIFNLNKMNKYLGFISMISLGLTISTILIGVVWNSPDGGFIHSLFRISATTLATFGVVWFFMFIYKELENE